jgi:chromosomal replication initiation ATPase DnaA
MNMTMQPIEKKKMPDVNAKIRALQMELTQVFGAPVQLSIFIPPVRIKNGERHTEKIFIGADGSKVIVNFDTVMSAVSRVYNVSEAEIKGPNRKPQNTRPRECLSYILYKVFEIYSYAGIAFLMGNRNHSTIMHQIQGYKINLQMDREFYTDVIDRVKKEMGL